MYGVSPAAGWDNSSSCDLRSPFARCCVVSLEVLTDAWLTGLVSSTGPGGALTLGSED